MAVNVAQHVGIVEHLLFVAGMSQHVVTGQQVGDLLQRKGVALDAGGMVGAAREGLLAQFGFPTRHDGAPHTAGKQDAVSRHLDARDHLDQEISALEIGFEHQVTLPFPRLRLKSPL